MFADLHVHTWFSDGLWPPDAVVEAALDRGLTHLAIADHDTLEGYRSARGYLEADPSPRITLIPAVEISTAYEGRDVHILGYYLEEMASWFDDELREIRERRAERTLMTAAKLESAGYPIHPSMLETSGITINRTALARLLVSEKVTASTSEAFELLIGSKTPFYTPRDDMETIHAVEAIQGQGGLAVIAHPALYNVEDLIPLLKEHGLAGIEAFHSEQTIGQKERLAMLADQLGLLVTGGSDWHQDPIHPAKIGEVTYPERYLERFLAADPRIA